MTNTDQDRWSRVKGRLRAEVGEDIFSSWFARMQFEGVDSETVRLSVPTRFLKSWIQSHYTDRVLACWKDEEPCVRRLDLIVRTGMLWVSAPASKALPLRLNGEAGPMTAGELNGHASAPRISSGHSSFGGSPLDPRLSFDTFVVGRSNSLAHAAAKQVAMAARDNPVMFNPLYVHAQVGLGKTHLLQAIAWAGNAAERRLLYLTAEKSCSASCRRCAPRPRSPSRNCCAGPTCC